MKLFSSFYFKLSLALLALASILSFVLLQIWFYINSNYSHEVIQKLNENIAMYITNAHPLIENNQVNQSEFQTLANRAMIVNPSTEIYLLDAQGNIISQHPDPENIKLKTIDITPFTNYLSPNKKLPIFAQNPRDPSMKNVFSVSPIIQNGETKAYLYAVLKGQIHNGILNATMDSHILKLSLATIIGSLLFFILAAVFSTYFLTKNLRTLSKKVTSFHFNQFSSFKDFKLESKKISDKLTLYQTQLTHKKPTDLNELEKLELSIYSMVQHIQEQLKKIESVDDTRRELIANISHDLRTPLAAMQGYIETLLIKNDSLNAQERLNFLNIVFKQGNKLSSLIEQLFELSKLESDRVELNLEKFSLTELIHDSIQENSWKAQEKNIQIHFFEQQDPLTITADIALIQRVLQNLLDNAIKHSPENNVIDIGCEKTESLMRFYIQDRGEGISSQDLPYIFERFYQSKDNTHSSKIGSGLGLAIVKRILDLHQYKVSVASQLQQGTRFVIDLPQH